MSDVEKGQEAQNEQEAQNTLESAENGVLIDLVKKGRQESASHRVKNNEIKEENQSLKDKISAYENAEKEAIKKIAEEKGEYKKLREIDKKENGELKEDIKKYKEYYNSKIAEENKEKEILIKNFPEELQGTYLKLSLPELRQTLDYFKTKEKNPKQLDNFGDDLQSTTHRGVFFGTDEKTEVQSLLSGLDVFK